jgi:hypothetical protein
VYTSYLLRRSYREGGTVRHENLGNLSHLPLEIINAIRKMLAGVVLVDLDEQFEIERSLPHGHVAAVLGVLRELDLERLLARERELYPNVVDAPEKEGGVPSRLIKTDAGEGRQEGTPWLMFAGCSSSTTSTTWSPPSMISRARARGG